MLIYAYCCDFYRFFIYFIIYFCSTFCNFSTIGENPFTQEKKKAKEKLQTFFSFQVRFSFELADGRAQMPTAERVTLTRSFYLFPGY